MNPLLALEFVFSESVVERLGWVLLHSLWEFTLVALMAGAAVRALRRSSAMTRYGVLVFAMAVSVAAPVATWMLQSGVTPDRTARRGGGIDSKSIGRSGEESNAAASPASDNSPLAGHPVLESDTNVAGPDSDHVASRGPLETPLASNQPAPSWSERTRMLLRPWLAWIVAGWSLGVVLCSLRPLLGWRTLRRLQRVGVSLAADEVQSTLRRVSQQLGLRHTVRVLHSTLARVPVVVGYMRPLILLPVGLMTNIPAAQLEAILAHELAHVQRHDFVVNLLQTLVETLFFYHPAMWWLSRQIRVEREHCCDDLVVKLLGNRVEYGRALVAIEELRGRSTVLVLGATDGSLVSRVRRIVGFNSDRAAVRLSDRWPVALLSLACVGAAIVLTTSWNLAAKDDATNVPQPVVAKLPGDVTVELIGIGFHPSSDREWWKADGSKLEQRPILKSKFAVISDAADRVQCREFVIQIRGLPNEPSAMTEYGVSNVSAYSMTDGLWVGETRAGPFKSKTTSIRVGLTTEPYGPTTRIDATGVKQILAELPKVLKPFYALISPLGVEEIDGQTALVLAGVPYEALQKSAAWELYAIDSAGQKHRSSSETAAVSGERHVAFRLPLSRLDRFEYRLRPYRHWVTFENVSLEPGEMTDVNVKSESLPEPTDPVAQPKAAVGPQPELGLGQRLSLVQWSHDSKQVYATGDFNKLTLWEYQDTGWVPTVLGADHHANSLAASRKSSQFVVGTNVGTAEVWEATTQKRQCELRSSPQYSVYAVAISPDDKLVAACATNGTVHVFDRESQKPIAVLGEKADTRMASLAFSPDSKTLAAMDRHGHLVLWSLADSVRLADWKDVAGEDCSVQWAPDGRQLAVSGPGRVTLIVAEQGSQPQVVMAPEAVLSRYPKRDGSPSSGPLPGGIRFASVTAIAPDVRMVASIAPDASVGIWDLATRKIIQKLHAPAESVIAKDSAGKGLRNLVFSPDGRRLACTTESGAVVVWQLAQVPDAKPAGLGSANRPSYAELSYYIGLGRFRLKQLPIAGDLERSVRHLDPLVSHLPEVVQTEAGRRFNEALQTIATISAERFEAAVDRIILDSHDLPAVYRSALMFNLWLFANECATDDDRRKEFGLEIMVLDKIKNKCAIAALEQAEEIPIGLALRLVELSKWSFPSLNEDDDPDWPANRRMKARLWLALMEKVRAVIDPDWDPKDRPTVESAGNLPAGATPDGLRDPELRAEYEARLEANRKLETYGQQVQARRLIDELSPRMEEDLIHLYVRKPFKPAQLESLLDQHAADKSQRNRVARSVRLVNALLPNGTQLKYGWPDALAEAGPTGVPALIAAVGDKTYPKFIRNDGAWALGLIGDPQAIDALTAVAEDEETPVKYKDIAREFVRALREKKVDVPQKEAAVAKPALRITGRVLDAKTGKPIEKCRLVWASVDQDGGRQITWQSQSLTEFTGGRFVYEMERPWEKNKFRIEADGYRPATTRVVNKGEDVEIDVQLVREIWAGVVRLPNGQPAAKAQLAVASWTNEIKVESSTLSYSGHGEKLRKIVETDEQGRFVMPAEVDPSVVVVAHESGYAEVSSGQQSLARKTPVGQELADVPQDTAVIELQPWGRVEGQVLMGDKPIVGAKYWVYQARADDVHVRANQNVETDDEGRFVVEKLPPGRNGTCQRYADNSDGQGSHSIAGLLVRFDIPAGKTAMLELGGRGRTLIGKLALPEGFPHKVNWSKVNLKVSLQAPHFSFRFGGSNEISASWSKFLQTDEGKLYGQTNVAIAADGSFRIEGLPAAEYVLSVKADEQAVIDDLKPNGNVLRGSEKLSVPAVVLPDAATPIDLGTIKLTPTKLGKKANDAGRADGGQPLATTEQARIVPLNDIELRADQVGTIVSLKVAKGAKVKEGAVLAVVKASETSKREELVAPLAGEVEKVFVQEGDRVKLGHAVVRIVQLGRVVVEGEMDLAGRASRDLIGKVEITPNDKDTFEFQGKVTFIDSQADANGNYRVRVEIENRQKDGKWLLVPGGMAKLTILSAKEKAPAERSRVTTASSEEDKRAASGVDRPEQEVSAERQSVAGEGGAWIQGEFGLEYRVRTEGASLVAGELPLLTIDIRNRGKLEDMCLESHQSQHAVVVDGVKYTRHDQPWGGVDRLSPGGTPITLAFALSDDWKRDAETKSPLQFALGRHQVALSIVIAPISPPQTDDDPAAPPYVAKWRSILSAPVEIEVRPGAWAGPPGSLGLENIRRELIAFPHFHSPKVPANLLRLVQEHQPAAGDYLVMLLESDDSTLHEAAAVVFGATWDSMSRKQIERYLLATMTHFVSKRSQYPQGVDAQIGMGTRHRPGYLGLPVDRKYSAKTVTTHYLDGQEIDKPFSYPDLGAQTYWIKTKDLALGRHTFRLATKYTFTRGNETYRGSYGSPEFAFEMVPDETPDDLLAPKEEQLDVSVPDALRIAETERELRHPPGEFVSYSSKPDFPDNDPWHPQVTFGANKVGVTSLHTPVWKLTKRLPVDLCFSVEFHIDNSDAAIRCQDLVALAGVEDQGYISISYSDVGDLLKHADKEGFVNGRLVFKPSRAVALTKTRVKRYYNGEITTRPLRFKISPAPNPDGQRDRN